MSDSNSSNNSSNNNNGLSQDEIRKILINMVADIVKQKYDNMAVYNEKTNKAISTIQNEKASGKYSVTPFDDTDSDKTDNIVKNLTTLLSAIGEGIGEATVRMKTATKKINKNDIQSGGFASDDENANIIRLEKAGKYHELLNVGENATGEEIKKAYRRMALKFHPDKNKSKDAGGAFKAISHAYEELTNDSGTGNGTGNGTDENKEDDGVLESSLNGASELGKILVQKGILASSKAVTSIFNFILKATTGDALLGQDGTAGREKINQRILLLTAVLQQLANDPLARKAIQDLSKEVTQETLEIIDITKPDINKIVDEILSLINDVAAKSAAGLTSTSINVAMSILGEIPFVGGLIDLTISTGRGFNSLMKITNVLVTKSGDATLQLTEMGEKIKNRSGNNSIGVNSFQNTANNLKNIVTKGLADGANAVKNVADSDAVQNATKNAVANAKSGAQLAKQKAQEVANSDAAKNAVANAKSGTQLAKQKAQEVADSGAVKNAVANAKSGAQLAKQKAQEVANSDAVKNAVANAQEVANSGAEFAKQKANKITGGGNKNKNMNTRKLRSHIAKSNKRLRKTIKLFHSTLPMMKYRTSINKNRNKKY